MNLPIEARPLRPEGLSTTTVTQVEGNNQLTLSDGQTIYLIGVLALTEHDPIQEPAITFTQNLLQGKEVALQMGAMDDQAYYVWIDNLLANYEILRAGYGNYIANNTQYDLFLEQAQQLAREENLGLWEANLTPLRINTVISEVGNNQDLNQEVIRLLNNGNEILPISGFTIRNNQGNLYTFPAEAVVYPLKMVFLYTGCGEDTLVDFYWCADHPLWEQGGETIRLSDANGFYVDHRDIVRLR